MAKVKKTPEEKLLDQIGRLLVKNKNDNNLAQFLAFQNSKIGQSVEHRERYLKTADTIERISKTVQRRSRSLKKKKDWLAEIRTMDLPL